MKKRVLLIVEAMGGGVGRHIIDLITNMDRNKYDFYLIHSGKRYDKRFEDNQVFLDKITTIYECDSLQREIQVSKDFDAYKFIKKVIRDVKPDLIHCHSSKAGVLGRLATKRIGGTPIFYTPHAYSFFAPEFGNRKKKIFIFVEKVLSRFATTKSFCVSNGELQEALQCNLDKPCKFEVIYNGIPPLENDQVVDFRRELGIDSNTVLIGNIARASDQKDPIRFIKIANEISKERANIRFVWIGDGPLLDSSKELIKELGLTNIVHFIGERADAELLVGQFDIFFSTAKYEGLPYALIESIRSQVPIIGSNTTGNNEIIIDGLTGYTFTQETTLDRIIQSIDEALSLDKGKIKDFFEDNFAIDKMIEKINKNYDRYL